MDTKTWRYVQEVQSQRAERDASAGKTRKKSATRKSVAPTTSCVFGKKLQNTTRLVPVVQDRKSLDGLQMGTTKSRDTAMIEFDALYRPYVYYLLERSYFLDGRGTSKEAGCCATARSMPRRCMMTL